MKQTSVQAVDDRQITCVAPKFSMEFILEPAAKGSSR